MKDHGHTVTEHLTEYLYCPAHKRQANLGIQNNHLIIDQHWVIALTHVNPMTKVGVTCMKSLKLK